MNQVSPALRTVRLTLSFVLAVSVFPFPAVGAAIRVAPVRTAPIGGAQAGIGAPVLSPIGGSGTSLSHTAPGLGSALPVPTALDASVSGIAGHGAPAAARIGVAVKQGMSPAASAGISAGGSPASAKTAASLAMRAKTAAVVPAGKDFRTPVTTRESLKELTKSEAPSIQWDGSGKFSPMAKTAVAGRSARGVNQWLSPSSWKQRLLGANQDDLTAQIEAYDWKPVPGQGPRGEVLIPQHGPMRYIRDRAAYCATFLNSFRWRITTRTTGLWRRYKTKAETTGPRRAVKNSRAFFLANLTMGSTGRFGMFGLRVTHRSVIISDAWKLYNRYFAGDSETTVAFSNLIARAHRYNPNKRATQFRKILQVGLREASVLPNEDIPAYFDSLATDEGGKALEEYQENKQQGVMEIFNGILNETILELNEDLPRGQRVVGMLLMGSFVTGVAGPDSDLDAQGIAENGSTRHLPEFFRRLKKKWAEAGMAHHPIGDFQYALPVSKGFIDSMHRDPYWIFSPYPDVVDALQSSPDEDFKRRPSKIRRATGHLFHAVYLTTLAVILVGYDLYNWSKGLIRGS